MTLVWNAGDDFDSVVDTLEEVTLKRAGCEESLVSPAWRFAERSSAIDHTEGAVRVVEPTWQLPIVEVPFSPSVGDRLIDAGSRCSTLYRVDLLRGATRLRCEARRVVIDPAAAEWFDLETAVWDPQQSTQDPIGWTLLQPAVRGNASRLAVEADESAAASVVEHFRLTFTEPVEATTNDRFVGRAGNTYRVIPQDFDDDLGGGWSYRAVRES